MAPGEAAVGGGGTSHLAGTVCWHMMGVAGRILGFGYMGRRLPFCVKGRAPATDSWHQQIRKSILRWASESGFLQSEFF